MTKNKSKELNYRRPVIVIPLKYKKNYAHIFTKESTIKMGHIICVHMVRHYLGSSILSVLLSCKGWSKETIAEVRDLYRNDFPKIFPRYNYVQLSW